MANKAGFRPSIIRCDPEKKDLDRAHGLALQRGKHHPIHAPFTGQASKMAKLITEPAKLIRRAKAVAGIWGTGDYSVEVDGQQIIENAWKPFEQALVDAGFTSHEISMISSYTVEDVLVYLGLDDI